MADGSATDSGALIFVTLADVYISSGMIDEAISILKDGLVRNPTYTLAKIILGRAYYIKGDIEEALKILEGVHEEAKDSENLNLYLGHCYKKIGEPDKAATYYETTLKINPENKEAKREIEILKPEALPLKPEEPAEEKIVEEKPIEAKIEEKVVEERVEEKKVIERVEEPKEEKVVEPPQVVIREEEKAEPAEMEPHVELPEPVEDVVPEGEPEEPLEMAVPLGEPEVIPPEPVEVAAPPEPFEALNEPINRLLNINTVKGAFISSKDGLLIQSYYKGRADIEEICALIAEIYNDVNESFKVLNEDCLERCIIEKLNETICVINAGDSLFTVVTQHEVKPGIIFVYARKIIEEIKEILG